MRTATKSEQVIQRSDHSGFPTPVWLVVCVLCVFIGVVAGYFVLDRTSYISLEGKTTLSASELDAPIATYTYRSKSYEITAREIISLSSDIGDAMDAYGSIAVPAAEDIITYAQNRLLLLRADELGLSVSDEEVAAFAQLYLGSDDLSDAVQSLGVSETIAQSTLTEAALIYKLQQEVTATELPLYPTAPDEPEEGASDIQTLEYGAYVVSLLGDAWDLVADTWASREGAYYQALSSFEFSATAATYEVAFAAYEVACTEYLEAYSAMSEEWSAYINALFSQATIQIGTLIL